MPVRYISSSVWVRLSMFAQLSILQYMGMCVFSLPISLVMIEIIYTLSYYHHQIGSMNYYPLFGVSSWNNGACCMSLYSYGNMNVIFRCARDIKQYVYRHPTLTRPIWQQVYPEINKLPSIHPKIGAPCVRLGPLKFSLRATIDHHGPSIHYITTITQLRSLELLTAKTHLLHMLYYMNWLTHDFWTRTRGWEFDRSHGTDTSSPSHMSSVFFGLPIVSCSLMIIVWYQDACDFWHLF